MPAAPSTFGRLILGRLASGEAVGLAVHWPAVVLDIDGRPFWRGMPEDAGAWRALAEGWLREHGGDAHCAALGRGCAAGGGVRRHTDAAGGAA